MSASAQRQDSICEHLNEITVTSVAGEAQARKTPTPITVVKASELSYNQFTNIIDAISKQPGVSQVTTGGAISKPVIRGLGYNRVLVVDRGVRQEGQQWGDEHGVEVDAMAVGSVEIQKGPATLMYGSDAMAGVIILHDSPIMVDGEHRLNFATEYQTNAGLFDYSLNAEGNKNGFVYNWRWTEKMAHDYKNDYDGYVPGSRFHERALSGMFGLNRTWGYSRLRLSFYNLVPGIVEGERDEETGELLSEDNGKHYHKTLPFQKIYHYKAVTDNTFILGESRIKAILAYQNNRRQEFEESKDDAGLDFMLHTFNYDVRWVTPTWGGWQTNVGIGGMYQSSKNKGDEYLIPAYDLFDFGVFATTMRSFFDRLHVSGGLRFDVRHLNSHSLMEDEEERFARFSRNFTGVTGSVGAVYNLKPNWDVRLNVSRGYRAPNMSELGSNGEHEGTLRYEVGNHELEPEFSWQFDLGTQFSSEYVSFEFSLFANLISNYIYLSRLDGQMVEDLPMYSYSQGDARLLGGEARVVVHPVHRLHIENSFSYVHSVLLDRPKESHYLPYTPAPRWLASVHYDLPLRSRVVRSPFVAVEMDYNLKQDNVYLEGDTETPTPSYVLFNVSLGTDIYRKGRKLLSISLFGDNIFDKTYQNHLSRLKYADVNNVTGRTGVYNMGRNFGVKLQIPIDL